MTTFETPPPGAGGRGKPRTRALAALAADLTAVPGAWARVGEYKTPQPANSTVCRPDCDCATPPNQHREPND